MSDLHIQLPSDTHAMLLGAAEARHISVEEFVREALEVALAQKEAGRAPNAVTQKAMREALQGKGFRKTTLAALRREFDGA